jgi:cytochrome c biogenesis protein CcmG, thiol:disulfide interchange protein DsbE
VRPRFSTQYAALGTLLVLALAACSGAQPAARLGSPAPDFTLPTADGGTVRLADLKGKPVLINFWATWCQPCREEMPMLQAAQKRYGARVQFVGVNTKDQPDWAAEFLQEVNITYPQVVDFDGQLLASVRSSGLPGHLFARRARRDRRAEDRPHQRAAAHRLGG